ncbi:hypothetical protein Acr_28g0004950 [Actinidia rufa]|uniref:RNase H type-1 domain-containing protein n=1 Tax=Actinidia rufa TaxID=165716 RepID=A0A7J0H9J2_9ERIC|nr:hypothetical protein Acr_28g0004950 [Actinidia rufa]
MVIKAQALADFIVEFTHDIAPELEMTLPEVETLEEQNSVEYLARWKLFVDGSSNQHGFGVGLFLQTLSGEQIEYAIRIGFKATNNKVEYEDLIAGLRVATELGVESLDAFNFKILQILREENRKADTLANLASAFVFISNMSIPLEFLPTQVLRFPKPSVKQKHVRCGWMISLRTSGMDHFHQTSSKLSGSNIDLPDFAFSIEFCTRDLSQGHS